DDTADIGRAYQDAQNELARRAGRLKLYEAVLNTTLQAVGIFDGDLHVIYANDALLRAMNERELVGRELSQVPGAQDHVAHVRRVLETGATVAGPDGNDRSRSYTYFPLPGLDERRWVGLICETAAEPEAGVTIGLGTPPEMVAEPEEPAQPEPAPQPVAEQVDQPAVEPVAEAAMEPEAEPAPEPVWQPEADSAPMPEPASPLSPAAQIETEPMPETATTTATAAPEAPPLSEDVALGYIQELAAPVESVREYVALVVGEAGAVAGDSSPLAQYALRAMSAADELERRVRGMAALARASRRSLQLSDVSLADLVERALSGLDQEMERSHARLKVDVPVDLPTVRSDGDLLFDAVTALLRNAITFVPADTRPRVLVKAVSLGQGKVRLLVEDNGIGFPQRLSERLFRLFGRLPGAEEYDGIGAGLAVARAAVERMGGSVGVESEEGWGSTFWLDLPTAAVPVESNGAASGRPFPEEIDEVIGDLTR
ncbi:MAG TPA: ATP-binding protein, partial [Gemmatimonadales bacterium]|nr:ATP-binding protein [Gemmatimonadales bacterium]